MGWLNWLAIAALGIGIVALGVSLGVPGPAGTPGAPGAMGLPGATGPAGSDGGTLMASMSEVLVVEIGPSCTNYMQLPILVPGPGSVVVSTTSILTMNHVAGTTDNMRYMTGTGPMDCVEDGAFQIYAVDSNLPTSIWIGSGASIEVFTVSGPGSFTPYLNAFMLSGQDPGDQFLSATMVVVFYPA